MTPMDEESMLERVARPLRGFGNALAVVVDAFFRVLGLPGRLLQDFLNGGDGQVELQGPHD